MAPQVARMSSSSGMAVALARDMSPKKNMVATFIFKTGRERIQGLVYCIAMMELVVISKGECVFVRVLIDLMADDSLCSFENLDQSWPR